MADEPNSTPSPAPTEALGNDPSVRAPDGTIKDPALNPSPTPEPKPEPKADAKPEPKADDKKPDAPKEGAPEKYEAFKAPDGYEVDEKFAGEASAIFKEMNLSQDQAQKLVDLYSGKVLELADAPYKAFEDLRNGWRKEVISDKDLGNGADGLKPEVAATIARAVDSLPPTIAKDFREALTLTGAGDNPAFVKAFYNLAQRLGEGSLVKGGNPSPGGQSAKGTVPSPAQALYPQLPSSNAR